MSNVYVGELDINITTEYEGKWNKNNAVKFSSKGDRVVAYKYIYFQNVEKRTCTCIIKSKITGKIKAVGVSKCSLKDKFDLGKGIIISEYKARIELFKNNIKLLGNK